MHDAAAKAFYGRDHGYWSFLQEARYCDDFAECPPDTKIISLRRDDQSWRRLSSFEDLEEVTAVSPSRDQLEMLLSLPLKRLRLWNVRKTEMAGIGGMQALEELALFNVHGVTSLAEVASLKKLRALSIENSRSLTDFSPLADAAGLKCLCICGALEKSQKVDDFSFLSEMAALEHFGLSGTDLGADLTAVRAIAGANVAHGSIDSSQFNLDQGALASILFSHLITPLVEFIDRVDGPKIGVDEARKSTSKRLHMDICIKGGREYVGSKDEVLAAYDRWLAKFDEAKERVV